MIEKVVSLIDRSLSTDTTPLAYLVTLHTLFFAGPFLLFGEAASVKASILFQIGVLVGAQWWAFFAVIACVLILGGLMYKNKRVVNAASFAMFLLWIFALIAYIASGFWFQGALAFITANYFGYFNLAVSLNRLWNYTPADY